MHRGAGPGGEHLGDGIQGILGPGSCRGHLAGTSTSRPLASVPTRSRAYTRTRLGPMAISVRPSDSGYVQGRSTFSGAASGAGRQDATCGHRPSRREVGVGG